MLTFAYDGHWGRHRRPQGGFSRPRGHIVFITPAIHGAKTIKNQAVKLIVMQGDNVLGSIHPSIRLSISQQRAIITLKSETKMKQKLPV